MSAERGYVWKLFTGDGDGEIWRRKFPHQCRPPAPRLYEVGDIFVCRHCQEMQELIGGSDGNRWADARPEFVTEFLEGGLVAMPKAGR